MENAINYLRKDEGAGKQYKDWGEQGSKEMECGAKNESKTETGMDRVGGGRGDQSRTGRE